MYVQQMTHKDACQALRNKDHSARKVANQLMDAL